LRHVWSSADHLRHWFCPAGLPCRRPRLDLQRYLMVAAPTLQATSSCEPVPPEQPIAPTSLPACTSGIPPREPITSTSVTTYSKMLCGISFSNTLVSRR